MNRRSTVWFTIVRAIGHPGFSPAIYILSRHRRWILQTVRIQPPRSQHLPTETDSFRRFVRGPFAEAPNDECFPADHVWSHEKTRGDPNVTLRFYQMLQHLLLATQIVWSFCHSWLYYSIKFEYTFVGCWYDFIISSHTRGTRSRFKRKSKL